jgi:hypothetical protein
MFSILVKKRNDLPNVFNTSTTMKRLQKQQETKKFIEAFVKEQKEWKVIELARQKEENDKIAAYSKMLQVREDEIKGHKKELEEARDKIYQKVKYTFLLSGEATQNNLSHLGKIARKRDGQQRTPKRGARKPSYRTTSTRTRRGCSHQGPETPSRSHPKATRNARCLPKTIGKQKDSYSKSKRRRGNFQSEINGQVC